VLTAQLVVVGAGPAGMEAALRGAELGLSVTVVDEGMRPGGQIYRQQPLAFAKKPGRGLSPDARDGERLTNRFAVAGITTFSGYTAWHVDAERRIIWLQGRDRALKIAYEALILAPGTFDRVVPFPGWTLPGVFTSGGMQTLLKSQHFVPGRRVVVAGSGPLNLILAAQLASAGAQVVALAEASRFAGAWRLSSALLKQPRLVVRAIAAATTLLRSKTRILRGYGVLRAEGDDHLSRLTLARLDRDWRPLRGTERQLDADALAIGYGFVPSTELAAVTGAELDWHNASGGWKPRHDAFQETTSPGVFVAGDGAGVAGVYVARHQGNLAAIGAAKRLGRLADSTAHELARPIRTELEGLAKFRVAMDTLYELRPGIYDRVTADTVVCRCEDVTRGQIEAAVRAGASSSDALKFATRAGMGPCQGRFCNLTVAALASPEAGTGEPASGRFRTRTPVKPLAIEELMDDLGEEVVFHENVHA